LLALGRLTSALPHFSGLPQFHSALHFRKLVLFTSALPHFRDTLIYHGAVKHNIYRSVSKPVLCRLFTRH